VAIKTYLPGASDLKRIFISKYGSSERMGWYHRMGHQSGYFCPNEHCEATLQGLISSKTRWLDIRCGSITFSSNPGVARSLSARRRLLVGIDPDKSKRAHPFLHEKIERAIENRQADILSDLITLWMAAEHIRKPFELARHLCIQGIPATLG
jgi:hypothetical protein